jgi:hypothetical protein
VSGLDAVDSVVDMDDNEVKDDLDDSEEDVDKPHQHLDGAPERQQQSGASSQPLPSWPLLLLGEPSWRAKPFDDPAAMMFQLPL